MKMSLLLLLKNVFLIIFLIKFKNWQFLDIGLGLLNNFVNQIKKYRFKDLIKILQCSQSWLNQNPDLNL